jgi:hypothetical protein
LPRSNSRTCSPVRCAPSFANCAKLQPAQIVRHFAELPEPLTSALGQKQTSDCRLLMSALPPKAAASARQEAFRHNAVRAAAHANARQRLSGALDAALALRNPPSPPEPTVVVVQEDDGSADFGSRNFDVAKWTKKPRSWF